MRQHGFSGQATRTHQEELAVETTDALAMLAAATSSDNQIIANLTASNASLTKQLAALQKKFDQLQANSNNTRNQNQNNQPRRGRGAGRGNAQNQNNQHQQPLPTTFLCWTCGSRYSHTSDDCGIQRQGHQLAAIEANKMGGKQEDFVCPPPRIYG